MKKNTIVDIPTMIVVTLIAIAGLFGIIFGGTLVKVMCAAATLSVIAITLKIYQNKPVYL